MNWLIVVHPKEGHNDWSLQSAFKSREKAVEHQDKLILTKQYSSVILVKSEFLFDYFQIEKS